MKGIYLFIISSLGLFLFVLGEGLFMNILYFY